jgi:stearoyl-CoA desaturase (Delta-9 desaturase)
MFMGDACEGDDSRFINLLRHVLFWSVHVACLAVFWVDFSWVAFAMCFALYLVRMFAITGWYHRYFSHRSFKTSRFVQFIFAVVGASAAQKGPIWWASHHRHHHKHSDTPEDIHSPVISGIYYAHLGWVLSSQFLETRLELVKDLTKFPELRLIDKYNTIPPILLAVAVFFFGYWLGIAFPSLNTSGTQMLVWGFFVSTVLVYHGTFCINSFTHLFGRKRFHTGDESRNSLLFALITLGEGWHNNHHKYQSAETQGMYWWEIDISHYLLKFMQMFGLVWDLRRYPAWLYEEAKGGLKNTLENQKHFN